MTALEDMTPEERAECVGMWCDLETPTGTEMVIYDQSRWSKETTLLEPGYGHFGADLSKVTPRFDLPRAWDKNGNPPTGKWKPDGEAEILRCL